MLAGCVDEAAVTPLPPAETVTGFAVAACSRRIAQLAQPWHARGISSRNENEAQLMGADRYSLSMTVSIDYGSETKTARVHCIVSRGGRVDSIDGMVP